MFGFRKKYQREIAHFVQLSGKLGRRLGVARSRARQAEIDRDFWRDRSKVLLGDLIEMRAAMTAAGVELSQYKRAVQREIDNRRTVNVPPNPFDIRPGA